MSGYYVDLAWRSLKRHPIWTLLMIVLIGVGVAASMTTWAALRAVSGDPVPGKSAQLFAPQIDNRGPKANNGSNNEPPPFLSYIDAMALLHADVAPMRTITTPVRMAVIPENAVQAPMALPGYATTADFFALFDVPFVYGSPWPSANHGGDSVVIGEQLNRTLFNGGNSVGKMLNIGGHMFRVAGVVGYWNPQPRFYAGGDVNALADTGEPTPLFVPFARAAALKLLGTTGSMLCPPSYQGSGWASLIASECDWITAWVALPTPADVRRYRGFLEGYAAQQQSLGRFQWAPNVRLRNLPAWLATMHAVPQENRMAVLMAIGLQVVCLLNTLALLLAKFMRRRGEIGVRRALGASRGAIAAQFLTEAAMVGGAGGLLGMGLTFVGVFRIGDLFGAKIAHLAHIDGRLLGLTLLVSVVATLVTALFPVWRAANVPPVQSLKSQ